MANASPSAVCLAIPCRKGNANLIDCAESTGHASRVLAVSRYIWVCLKNEDALESMAMKIEENCQFLDALPIEMVIFHSYVELPEAVLFI